MRERRKNARDDELYDKEQHVDFLLESVDDMADTRSATAKPQGLEPEQKGLTATQKRVASAITKAIEDLWPGSDVDLAIRADVSQSGLSLLKSRGADKITSNLKKVCAALGIDKKAALRGHIVKLSPEQSQEGRIPLSAAVKEFESTEFEQYIQAAIDLARLAKRNKELASH